GVTRVRDGLQRDDDALRIGGALERPPQTLGELAVLRGARPAQRVAGAAEREQGRATELVASPRRALAERPQEPKALFSRPLHAAERDDRLDAPRAVEGVRGGDDAERLLALGVARELEGVREAGGHRARQRRLREHRQQLRRELRMPPQQLRKLVHEAELATAAGRELRDEL